MTTKIKRRGKTRSKNSTYPFAGIGLKPEEDKKLMGMLENNDLSAKQLLRALVRQWMENGGSGVLKYNNDISSIKRIAR